MTKKRKTAAIIISILLIVCILFFGYLFLRDRIGVPKSKLEADIRSTQQISDSWTVVGEASDKVAAYISYPDDKSTYTFSVYLNHPGFSFGYFFYAGGKSGGVDSAVAEFSILSNPDYDEKAFISMNMKKASRLEINDGNTVRKIDIDSNKPFAIVLPVDSGEVTFYDVEGNVIDIYPF